MHIQKKEKQDTTKRILIIDDEDDFCYFIKANLELYKGYDVSIASNGKEGIRLAKKKAPDLILLDITMPVMDGYAVLRALKEEDKTKAIPVFMLSARTDYKSKVRSSELWGEDYITKPIEIEFLRSKIEKRLFYKI